MFPHHQEHTMIGRRIRLRGTGLAPAFLTQVPIGTASHAAGDTCAAKPKPAGKVLQGWWENRDGAAKGVHPGLGWIPITHSRLAARRYNVLGAVFPVILVQGR
jgi:hypothetical protein